MFMFLPSKFLLLESIGLSLGYAFIIL